MKNEIYKIIDSFLVEAKDQNGNERSLERLNEDRHLAAEALEALFSNAAKKLEDNMMDGDLREAFETYFPKDDDTNEHPSKSNRSGALAYMGLIMVELRKMMK
jgi:hypothetical protein